MVTMTYDKIDSFVSLLQRKNVPVRWDGWNLVFFKEDRKALRSKNGRRNGDRWGFETVISPGSNGKWVIPNALTRMSTIG